MGALIVSEDNKGMERLSSAHHTRLKTNLSERRQKWQRFSFSWNRGRSVERPANHHFILNMEPLCRKLLVSYATDSRGATVHQNS